MSAVCHPPPLSDGVRSFERSAIRPKLKCLRGVAIAEITFDADAVLWLGVPPVASIAVLAAGVLIRKRAPRTASFLGTVGIIGVIASAGWIALAFYVDSVVQ